MRESAEFRTSPISILLDKNVYEHTFSLRENFESEKPFKHVLIEPFFENNFRRELVEQFPVVADPSVLRNEFGGASRKSARADVRNLGPAYRKLDDLFRAPEFLAHLSAITGVENLVYDPEYHGAGTHENLNGQAMDPHVDFNYHRTTGFHRRLNLIIYLNEDWQPDWGGAIEFHKNPWDFENDKTVSYLPLMNHAVIFETTETSWHGFERVSLPQEHRDRSRRSITVYYYTKERPPAETAPKHATIYVQRGIPKGINAGEIVTLSAYDELHALFHHRNGYLKALYERETGYEAQLASARGRIREFEKNIKLPLWGYAEQTEISGLFPDGWTAPRLSVKLRPAKPVTGIFLRGRTALEDFSKLKVLINGAETVSLSITDSAPSFIPASLPADDWATIEVVSEREFRPSEHMPSSGDVRVLGFHLVRIELQHGVERKY